MRDTQFESPMSCWLLSIVRFVAFFTLSTAVTGNTMSVPFQTSIHSSFSLSLFVRLHIINAIQYRTVTRITDTSSAELCVDAVRSQSVCYIPNVRFEVFTTVTMKNGVFWDVTLCGFCKNRPFGGT
jgi:hypothetical protein